VEEVNMAVKHVKRNPEMPAGNRVNIEVCVSKCVDGV
jgi:hypothetical protein